ncbi:MAG: hypothetical protein K8W52_27590 [Deltaproteobacteria bacterium]|nr:hypothetical protein [Deltaproteobacteria bacterium]
MMIARARGWLVCAAVAAPLAGCYQPVLRDCTVTCGAVTDCATGQRCAADGFCVGQDVVGTCGPAADASTRTDARRGADARADGGATDAAIPADAAPVVGALRITIVERGTITVAPINAICAAPTHAGATCTFAIPIDTVAVITAAPNHPGDAFAAWTTTSCAGQGAACTLTCATALTIVGARFDHPSTASADR